MSMTTCSVCGEGLVLTAGGTFPVHDGPWPFAPECPGSKVMPWEAQAMADDLRDEAESAGGWW